MSVQSLIYLVHGLGLKSSYQFTFLPLTIVVSDTSSGLFQQTQHLTNTRTLVRAVVQALLDQLNQRVVPTELATGTELGVHVSHVNTASLQFKDILVKARGNTSCYIFLCPET